MSRVLEFGLMRAMPFIVSIIPYFFFLETTFEGDREEVMGGQKADLSWWP